MDDRRAWHGWQAHIPQIEVVVVGATGMVGGTALRYALKHPAVAEVTTLGRRKTGLSHPKLREVVHESFADCSALAEPLSGFDAAIFCLGVYTGTVSDEELRRTTVDYAVEFARAFELACPKGAFSLLSGAGADQTGRSRMAFARYKGEAEKALLGKGFPRLYIFRPAYIYPVEPRKEPNLGYRLMRVLYPLFRLLLPNQVIRSDDLAHAMVDVVVDRTRQAEAVVFENDDIRRLVRSGAPPGNTKAGSPGTP